MSVIGLLLTLTLIGLVAWLLCQVPQIAPYQKLVGIVALIIGILIALQAFGVLDGLRSIQVPRV